MALPTLNWQEIALLASLLRPEVEGLFVDRLIVPERPRFPNGYVKGEFALRLTGRRKDAFLLLSVRPRQPYLAYGTGKGPRAAADGTHSPFSLSLAKHLRGAKILGLEALPRERILALWFAPESGAGPGERLGLVLCLIPAVPEALLVRDTGAPAAGPQVRSDTGAPAAQGWRIVTRSRITPAARNRATPAARSQDASPTKVRNASAARSREVPGRTASRQPELFVPPDGAQAPASPAVREELLAAPEALLAAVESGLEKQAFELRLRAAERGVRDLLKQARERERQSETARREAEREPDWQRYGDLLKAALPSAPATEGEPPRRMLQDFATGERIAVPCDPKLGPREQVEKFYQLARRKARRLGEARARAEGFSAAAERLEKALSRLPAEADWAALERFERASALRSGGAGAPVEGAHGSSAAEKPRKGGKGLAWLGKSFVSRDGLSILVGRSRDENLELTFKHARGNDVWLHVRGRPGAHVIVPLQPGKSAPLETLLDAATLAIYYSGGENWGKTEVDYTFKKHVKRIKDSTEASYVNNKTLIVEPDEGRIKRLLGTSE